MWNVSFLSAPVDIFWSDSRGAVKRHSQRQNWFRGQRSGRGAHLTSRTGAAVSWMDRMWVMLCCINRSLSRASVDRTENHRITSIASVWSQISSHLTRTSSAQQQTSCSHVSRANSASCPETFALILNWKKNRKTNVSKTDQQLGSKQETVIVLIKFVL